jgi:glycosyltransferase involved in cell wall biosynthesis
MASNNLHISLTDFRNESRILKEVRSLVKTDIVDKVYIASLWGEGLSVDEGIEDDINLHRFNLITRHWAKSFAVQLFKYFEFSVRIFFYYRCKKINIINVHALASLLLGVVLKHMYGAKLIYDAHELETEVEGVAGFRKFLNKLLERVLIHHADLTIVVSESIADWYVDEYRIKRPVVILNVPAKYDIRRTDKFRKQFPIGKDQLIFLYQGGLVSGRGVDLIIKTFKERKDNRAVVVLMGYGPLQADAAEASANSRNIFLHSAVAPDVVLDYTASADVGLSLIENTCLSYYYCMPNKLFEYAMAGLPVLVSSMKDMAEFVRNRDMGLVVDDLTSSAINFEIEKFLSFDLEAMRERSKNAAVEHAWEVQEEKLLLAFRKL